MNYPIFYSRVIKLRLVVAGWSASDVYLWLKGDVGVTEEAVRGFLFESIEMTNLPRKFSNQMK